MTQEEIKDAVYKLLFEESKDLNREDYRDLLEETIFDCKTAINALDEDDIEDN